MVLPIKRASARRKKWRLLKRAKGAKRANEEKACEAWKARERCEGSDRRKAAGYFFSFSGPVLPT
jgi:hypothetical protein